MPAPLTVAMTGALLPTPLRALPTARAVLLWNVWKNLSSPIHHLSLRTTSIKFFTIGIDYKVSNLDLTKATQEQRNIYSALMNYPFVERALLNVQNLIKNWFSNYLNGINDILIGFAVGIVILNFILIGVTIFFIYEFINVLNRSQPYQDKSNVKFS